jgi:hypothetical protein
MENLMKPPYDYGRRNILKAGSVALAAIAAGTVLNQRRAAAAEAPKLDEKDPQAQALGYRHDATKVDHKKFATYQPGQACANCQQFQGKAGADWAPCTIFQGKDVNAKGWCSAWVKKAGGAEAPLKG